MSVERTPEQQLNYTKYKLNTEAKLYDHLLAKAVSPPADMQVMIIGKQAKKVEHWKQEVERLQQADRLTRA